MPIAVKDYIWEQSEDSIFIMVPLKGVASHKVDIISTEKYIKINYPPFLFECFLNDEVQDEMASVEMGNDAALFKIKKQNPCMWPVLQNQEAVNDKAIQRQLREEAIERYRVRSEQRKKEKDELKHELGRLAVKQQMKLEENDRKRIEAVKEAERKQATIELESWKQKQTATTLKDRGNVLKTEEERQQKSVTSTVANGSTKQEAASQSTANQNQAIRGTQNKKEIFEEAAGSAPVRKTATICVKFTSREFPTPMRESMAHEEDEWLAKQAEARRMIDLEDSEFNEEERNPVWLCNKGDTFYKAGNYQAAVNVYTHAIRLNCKMPAVYSNRAACHLQLNNLFKCIEDTSKALELLTPPVQQNKAARLKAHVRRGTAFCKLQLYVEGLMDYEAALKLDPDNKSLAADADNIRQIVQSSTSQGSTPQTNSLNAKSIVNVSS